MSNVNYSINHKGVRLIPSEKAWVRGKNGKRRLNRDFQFIGKVDTTMPNMIISASDKSKPKFKGDINTLNSVAKGQMVDHFYDEKGKRNRRTVAYFGVPKKNNK